MKSITEIYQTLLKTYGKQNWWPAETPFEVCVGAVLTQNTNWKNVEKAIENLKRENLLTPDKIVTCPKAKLEKIIKPAGFFRQKAEYLKNLSKFIIKSGGIKELKEIETQKLRSELLKIKGIGKETADSIILYAFEKPSFVVDTYTKRIFYRLNLISSEKESYGKVKERVEREIKPADENLKIYKELHALIVEHAKTLCNKKIQIKKCNLCPLKKECILLQ